MHAASMGHGAIVEMLLAPPHAAGTDAADGNGMTALMEAAAANRPRCAAALLRAGGWAALEAQSRWGDTPASIAARAGHPEVEEVLAAWAAAHGGEAAREAERARGAAARAAAAARADAARAARRAADKAALAGRLEEQRREREAAEAAAAKAAAPAKAPAEAEAEAGAAAGMAAEAAAAEAVAAAARTAHADLLKHKGESNAAALLASTARMAEKAGKAEQRALAQRAAKLNARHAAAGAGMGGSVYDGIGGAEAGRDEL
jgi:hypothetical protein